MAAARNGHASFNQVCLTDAKVEPEFKRNAERRDTERVDKARADGPIG
jgi:hypothetical protein